MTGAMKRNERLQREIAKLEVKLEPYWGVDSEELPKERKAKQLRLIGEIEKLHAELLQDCEEAELEAFAIKDGHLVENGDGIYEEEERRTD